MANMSEEWRQSILEDVYTGPLKKKESPSPRGREFEHGGESGRQEAPKVNKGKPQPGSASTRGRETDPILLDRQGRNPDGSPKPKSFPGPNFGR